MEKIKEIVNLAQTHGIALSGSDYALIVKACIEAEAKDATLESLKGTFSAMAEAVKPVPHAGTLGMGLGLAGLGRS